MNGVHKKLGTFCRLMGNFLENILAVPDNLRYQLVQMIHISQYF